jgi:hypothetical protein
VILPTNAALWRIGAAVTLAAALWWHGYSKGREGPLRELAAVQAVATATDARYRQLETEVASAQQAYVDNWRRTRDASESAWVRLRSESRSRVPAVCPELGGPSADPGHGLEASSGAGARDLLPAVVGALETAERIEQTLALCQAELRQCAGIR